MMPLKALIGAVLVQVALTLALLLWLGVSRARSARRGEVRIKDIALSSQAWSDRIKQIANAYANQLELPVLFYVAALLAIMTGTLDWIVVGLSWAFVAMRLWNALPGAIFATASWLFVATRYAHAYIHVTHNRVLQRFQVFIGGFAVLTVLWLYVGLRVMTA